MLASIPDSPPSDSQTLGLQEYTATSSLKNLHLLSPFFPKMPGQTPVENTNIRPSLLSALKRNVLRYFNLKVLLKVEEEDPLKIYLNQRE